MRIPKIDHSFEECKRYLEGEGVDSKFVESLLAHSLLILICAEFESKVRELVTERSQKTISDGAMREFVRSCLDNVFRSPSLDNVKALLGRFEASRKDSFRGRLRLDERAQLAYDSILKNRNSVAHGEGSGVTIGEVREFYERAHTVLDYFREALFADNGSIPSGC